ncbi:MAG: PEP-CTERM sorting domain-containing protein [Verrucomicrobia bacterium]|nr:PEP-CTERM sorting domain-containing protein [Verrucomicrobiota bacterium]
MTPSSHLTDSSRRLRQYCAAGLVAAGAATSADAAVVFVNFSNQLLTDQITTDSNYTSYPIDLDSNGTVDIRLAVLNFNGTFGAAAVYSPVGGNVGVIGQAQSGFFYPARLGGGVAVGAAGPFVTLGSLRGDLAFSNGEANSQWLGGGAGSLGFRFTLTGGGTAYGWLQFSIGDNSGPNPRAITLISGAYETSGASITTIPEPTTAVGILALGAAGLLAHRRSRAKRES